MAAVLCRKAPPWVQQTSWSNLRRSSLHVTVPPNRRIVSLQAGLNIHGASLLVRFTNGGYPFSGGGGGVLVIWQLHPNKRSSFPRLVDIRWLLTSDGFLTKTIATHLSPTPAHSRFIPIGVPAPSSQSSYEIEDSPSSRETAAKGVLTKKPNPWFGPIPTHRG